MECDSQSQKQDILQTAKLEMGTILTEVKNVFVVQFKLSRMAYCQCTECPSPHPGTSIQSRAQLDSAMDNITWKSRNGDEQL